MQLLFPILFIALIVIVALSIVFSYSDRREGNSGSSHLNNAYIGRARKQKTQSKVPVKLLAYKSAIITGDFLGALVYQSPTAGGKFGIKEYCTCNNLYTDPFSRTRKPTHHFDPDCSCGWYSFKEPENAFDYPKFGSSTSSEPILELALSGQFVEYDYGFRSEIIRVKRVLFDKCYYCNQTAVAATWIEDSLVGICYNHAKYYGRLSTNLISFNEMESLLPQPADSKTKMTLVRNINNTKYLTTIAVKRLRWMTSARFFNQVNKGANAVGEALSNIFYR